MTHEKPFYPNIIPYPTPSPSDSNYSKKSEKGQIPRLLSKKSRPPTVTSKAAVFKYSIKENRNLKEDELRDKYFQYWEEQRVSL